MSFLSGLDKNSSELGKNSKAIDEGSRAQMDRWTADTPKKASAKGCCWLLVPFLAPIAALVVRALV